jgi:Protein of unknown function (DUF3551)
VLARRRIASAAIAPAGLDFVPKWRTNRLRQWLNPIAMSPVAGGAAKPNNHGVSAMRNIRLFALVLLACLPAFAMPARAIEYPWCAHYNNGGKNCGFSTFKQCLATVSGAGGFCEQNPFYSGPAELPAKHAHKKQYD